MVLPLWSDGVVSTLPPTDITQTRATLTAQFADGSTQNGFQIKYGTLLPLSTFAQYALSASSDPVDFSHSSLAWKEVTSKGWVESYYDGKSGPAAGTPSEFTTTVTLTEPTLVRFEWMVASEEGIGFLSFRVDDQEIAAISGMTMTDFATVEHTVAAGEHTLVWRYQKSADSNIGLDLGRVRNICLLNTTPGEWIDWAATDDSARVTGLYPGQQYLFRAYSDVDNGRLFSTLRQFSTPDVSIGTVAVSGITQTKASLSSDMDMGDAEVRRGFLIGSNPLWNDEFSRALIKSCAGEVLSVTYDDTWKVGDDCVYMDTNADNKCITIQVKVDKSTEVSFDWAVKGYSSSSRYSKIRFYVDNIQKTYIGANSNSSYKTGSYTYVLTPGTHTLKWDSWYYGVYGARLQNLRIGSGTTPASCDTIYVVLPTSGEPMYPPIPGIKYIRQKTIYSTNEQCAHQMVGLLPGRTYWFRSFARPIFDTVFPAVWEGSESDWELFTTLPVTATATEATDIRQASATIRGVVAGGDATVAVRGLQFLNGTRWIDYPQTADSMSVALQYLRPNTTYTYRAYIQAAGCDTVYSEDRTFTTLAVQALRPTVTHRTQHTVTIQGEVVAGDATIYCRGMLFREGTSGPWQEIEDSGSDSVFVIRRENLPLTGAFQACTYVQAAGCDTIFSATLSDTTAPIEAYVDSVCHISQHTAQVFAHFDCGDDAATDIQLEVLNCSSEEWTYIPVTATDTAFVVTLDGLTPCSDYIVCLSVKGSDGRRFTSSGHFSALFSTLPYVTTLEATDVLRTEATLHALLLPMEEKPVEVGFLYYPEGSMDQVYVPVAADGDEFSCTVRDLQPGVWYLYAAYCRLADGRCFYGYASEFTTQMVDVKTVVTNVTETTATFRTELDGGEAVPEAVQWYVEGREWTDLVAGETVVVDGLRPGCTYAIGFRYTVNGQTYYNWNTTFTTRQVSVSARTEDVCQTSFAASCLPYYGDATMVESGIEFQGTDWHDGELCVRITDLAPGTQYTYRAYLETAEGGRVCSDWQTLTTLAITTATKPASQISNRSATLSGEIVCDSYSPTYCFGFQWKRMEGWAAEPRFTIGRLGDDGNISLSLVNGMLEPNTDYQYRTAVRRTIGENSYEYYADTEWKTFRTEMEYVLYPASVYTLYRTDSENNAIVFCGYYVAGSESVQAQGYEYWMQQSARAAAEVVRVTTDSTMVYALDKAPLADGLYQVRAFVQTETGTYYGQTLGFSVGEVSGMEGAEAAAEAPVVVAGKGCVRLRGVAGRQCEVYDAAGRCLLLRTELPEEETIGLVPGAYVVRISPAFSFKIMVE